MAYWHWETLSTPFMKTKRTRAEKLRRATQPVCRDANVYLSKSRLYGLQQAFRWLLICRPSSDLWGPEVLRQQQHQTPHIIGGLARLGDKTTTWFRQVPSIFHVQGIGAISSRNQCQRRMVACSLRKNGHEFPAHRVHARWQHGPMASGGYEGCEGWHGQYCSVRRRQWRLRLQRRQWRLRIVHVTFGTVTRAAAVAAMVLAGGSLRPPAAALRWMRTRPAALKPAPSQSSQRPQPQQGQQHSSSSGSCSMRFLWA